MSRKEDAAYGDWLDDIKSKNPDVADHLDALAETDAGREIYRGGLREADYYRRLNEVRDAKQELDREAQEQVTWWQEAKPEYERAVTERDEALARLEATNVNDPNGSGGNGAPNPPLPTNPQELELIKQRMTAMDQAYPQVMLGMFEAQQAALQEGLKYKPDEVLQRAFEKRIKPIDAFNELVTDQRQEKAKFMLEGELDKARQEGYKQALSKISGPDKIMSTRGPSIVDALSGTAEVITDERERRDAAVAEYIELTSEQA